MSERIRYKVVRPTVTVCDLVRGGGSYVTCPLAISLKRLGVPIGSFRPVKTSNIERTLGVYQKVDSIPEDIQLSAAAAEFVELYDADDLSYDEAHQVRAKLFDSMPQTYTVFVPEA